MKETLFLFLILFLPFSLHPEEYPLTLIDTPYNIDARFKTFSMEQSLNITFLLSRRMHDYTARKVLSLNFSPWIKGVILAGTLTLEDMIFDYLPGGYGWLHEEWHRSVMGLKGINSFDEIYLLPFFSKYVSVSHVKDSDLIYLKKYFPHYIVRLDEAGVEGQFYLTEKIRDCCFVNNSICIEEIPSLLTNIVNSELYITLSASKEADRDTEKFEKHEGTNILKRDFTGLDFTAWVYDLFRPYEPYKARGIHPSGVGIKRYIAWSQLSKHEQKYLRLQSYLTWLNLISPQLIGFSRIAGRWNFYLTHYLTDSGFLVEGNILNSGSLPFKFTLENYFNLSHWFPGISLKFFPIKIFKDVEVSGKISLFTQPEEHNFFAEKRKMGEYARINLALPLKPKIKYLFSIGWKSYGWVKGISYIEPVFMIKTGIILNYQTLPF